MSEPKIPLTPEEIEALTQEADAASKAEDWERAIALFRKLQDADRIIHGSEAKLQWALRMRDIEKLYQQGKTHLAAAHYEQAVAALRKARVMYASHYKDVDALIVQAQTALQKEKWDTRPASAKKKGCFLMNGALVIILFFASLIACNPTASAPASAPATAPAANAAKIQPPQRSQMYKSAPAMTIDPNKTYSATIKTAKGDIVVELYPKDAPQHVNNFVFLAREGFYNNLTFHRVEPGFVIQGGDPLGSGSGGPGYTVPAEIKGKHTKGALAMARLGDQANPKRDSSGSQFYITLEATPFLDGQYTAFGQVTKGFEVAEKIARGDVIQSVTIEEK